MHFVALDVETANPDMGSICQIGLARFADGKLAEEWSALIDPEDHFAEVNIGVHGIEPHMVRGKPTFPKIVDHLQAQLQDTVTVCHTHFDRVALSRATGKYGIAPISTTWLDSARVARRTWNDVAEKGYGLAQLCDRIGYQFKHHDALEDAKAAGHVLLAALRESNSTLEDWLERVREPIARRQLSHEPAVHRDGNPEGNLYGHVIVFTGALSLPRHEAADIAALVGCRVDQNVTKKTTILVVGDQDARLLNGHDKSGKHRKAEVLAAQGLPIKIICESDFRELVRIAD